MKPLSDLFNAEYLHKSANYRLPEKSLDHCGLSALFAKIAGNYCQTIWGMSAGECKSEPPKKCGVKKDDCPTGKACVNDENEPKGYRCVGMYSIYSKYAAHTASVWATYLCGACLPIVVS